MERRQLQQQEAVIVSEYALVLRLERALRKRGLLLKKAKAKKQKQELGRFFIVDPLSTTGNFVHAKHIDLELYARSIGCLEKWEKLEDKK